MAACLLAGLIVVAAGGSDAAAKPKAGSKAPNIVVVMTDDQARSTLSPEAMPNLYSRMVEEGTSFSDYVVTTPLCCPSRAGFLTGQYGHNNGVLGNFYPDLKQKKQVLPAWLQQRGYKTAHVGKFLNKYEEQDKPQTVAPGWDRWFTQLEKRKYYDWKASKNGRIVRFGEEDSDHLTTVTNEYATDWAGRLAAKDKPFYLEVDYYAPHTGPGRDDTCKSAPKPAPEDVGRFAATPLPDPPSFNQPDVSQMPSFIRDRPQLTPEQIDQVTQHYRCSLDSLYGVDRGIGQIFDAIQAQGELNRTVFVFTSDNGYFYGEHRIPKGKPYPYEENIHMPLTIRVPTRYRGGGPVVPQSDAPSANIDIAPTLLELAGASPCIRSDRCRTLDGRSLMPAILGTGGLPETRGIALERSNCDFRGVRWDRKLYISYSAEGTTGCVPGEAEMYDVGADPFQLDDLLPTQEGTPNDELRRKLARKMRRLGSCQGIRHRDPEPPAGIHFCE
ncbi:MAG: sulfatase [Solirubrobacterales bacterium]|nr:sulfatase [Solirubrobacterales bacterium]